MADQNQEEGCPRFSSTRSMARSRARSPRRGSCRAVYTAFGAWAMPPTRTEGFQDHGWKVPPGQTRGTVAHLAARNASVRSDTPMQRRANPSVGRGGVGRAAGTMPIAAWAEAVWDEQLDDANRSVGMEATGGPEAVVEQSEFLPRALSSCA